MKDAPVIELLHAGIAREPGAEPLLSDVSWHVLAGDFWVVTGSHGTGKSALLETMAGLRPCDGGELRWFGEPVALSLAKDSGRTALRQRVGLVFEGGGRVFSQLSVAENLALPVSYHTGCSLEEALDRTAALRTTLELDRLAAAPAGRVGRAWMQRVALGRALALAPEVLLLDNPVAGLDPSQVRWWQAFLTALSAGNAVTGGKSTTLIVTADDARPWADIGRQFAEVRARSWKVVDGSADPGLSRPAVIQARG